MNHPFRMKLDFESWCAVYGWNEYAPKAWLEYLEYLRS